MNPIWKELLDNRGELNKLSVEEIQGALIPLEHHTILKIAGNDAEKFLQGQLTNDVKNLQDSHWQLNCACNQKGRIISVIWLIKYHSEYLALIEAGTTELLLQELKKFAMFSKVSIEKDDRFYIIGTSGTEDQELNSLASLTVSYGKTIPQSFLLFTAENLAHIPKNKLIISEIAWQYLNIINGIPEVFKSTQERFTPHQLNLPQFDAVNFKKGCYRGQEIIARMQYLGKLKESMEQVNIQSNTTILPGELLIDQEDKVLGEIINIVPSTDNHYFALAVIKQSEINGTIALKNNRQLEVLR